MIEVLKPGLLTTVQDLGRIGYEQYGLVSGGAVDTYALQVANILVGNQLSEACLEMTGLGPSLRAREDMYISIAGGDLSPNIQGKSISMWRSLLWKKNEILTFKGLKSGWRSYLAIAGGIIVPLILGSRSTYLPAQWGGFKGRALECGDIIHIGSMGRKSAMHKIISDFTPTYSNKKVIRVILGPHTEFFTPKGMKAFLSTPYIVTNEMNRMGMRLCGEKIEHKDKADILSQATTFGTIQVAANGQPMVLLADRQITGGYTQIGTVISCDYSLLAQSRPGDILTFKQYDLKKAQKDWRKKSRTLLYLQKQVQSISR